MNANTQKICLDLLAGMPSSSPWTEASAALYIMALEGWADDVALGAVKHACLTLEWRPAPVKLREVAVEKFAPAPSPYALRQSLRDMLVWHGARQAHRYEMKVPLLAALVDGLGGWEALERMTSEEIDDRFDRAYTAALRDWHSVAAESVLCLPPAERGALASPDIRRLSRQGENLLLHTTGRKTPEKQLEPLRSSLQWPQRGTPSPKDGGA